MSALAHADPRAAALAARAADDRAGALALFLEAGDPWSRADAALELLALDRRPEARVQAEALTAERPHFAPAHRTLGLIARADGRREAALAHFEAAAACDRSDLWNRHDAAVELRALGRMTEAEDALRTLAGGTPLPHALRTLAAAARARGDADGALAALRVAADLLPTDPWFLLDHAEALVALERLDEAGEALAAVTQRHPRFAGAHRALARLAARRGDHDAALIHWREVAALDPAAGTLDLADALLERSEWEKAETLAARHLARHGSTLRPLRLLARAARRRGDTERAHAHTLAASRLEPGDASVRAELAADALALGRTAEAEREARAALSIDAACQPARRTLALALRAGGDTVGALALARTDWAVGAGPDRAGFDLAADLRASGAFAEASSVYEILAGRPDAAAEALVELALLARRRQGVEAARAQLMDALCREPVHPRALICLGDLERECGRFAEADDAYARALAARPGATWAMVGQALLAEARGDHDGAAEALHKAIAADPAEHHARIALAGRLVERGNAEGAHALLEAIPSISPRAAEAAMARARIARLLGDHAGARRLFLETAERWSDHADALVEAAEECLRLGRADEATDLLARAETHRPDHPALWEARARHALSRDDLAAAAGCLERAEQTDPGRLWPSLMGARIQAMLGDPAAATARFEAAARHFGPRPEIALLQAETERQLGRIDEAESRLDAALARFPGHSQIATAAALAAIETGRLTRAERLIEQAPATTRTERARLHFARAQLAAARWDFETAIDEGETAVRLAPADGWYRNRLAHAALLSLDLDRVAEVLADAAALEAGANALRGKSANPSQSHYGQLLDEFRLDVEAVDTMRSALGRPAAGRLAALSDAVRAFPDSTAAAILCLIEARRSGALPSRIGTGDGGMPCRIHQFWTDDTVPPDVAAYMATWKDAHPHYDHRIWNDGSARAFLAAHAAPSVRAAFDRAREPAMKADLFRLALLAHEGGIWADADDRCLQPVDPLLSRGAGLLAYQEDLGSVGNNWLAARAKHPLLLEALAEAAQAVNRGDGEILWLATGPGLLSRVVARAHCNGTGEAEDVLILDRAEFLAHVAIHCLAAYKSSERHWSRTAFGRVPKATSQAARSSP